MTVSCDGSQFVSGGLNSSPTGPTGLVLRTHRTCSARTYRPVNLHVTHVFLPHRHYVSTAGVSTTVNAPSSPRDGDLWWDEEDGSLFIYYNDGDSAQWVEASPGTIADDTIVSDFFKSKVTLLIKNSAGTTLKTIFSPGV